MTPLRLLIVEDVEDDAELLVRELRRGGVVATFRRVDTEAAMVEALNAAAWDVVTCDNSMPRFSALAALETLHRLGLDIPLIIVSGTIGEDAAVAAMKAGATDYLMKDQLKRLAPAVVRECREAQIRAARRQSDKAAKESAALYRSLVETLPDGVGVAGLDRRFVLSNERLNSMLGYEVDELVGKPTLVVLAPEALAQREMIFATLRDGGSVRNVEVPLVRKDGTCFLAEFSATKLLDAEKMPSGFLMVVRDITDRKQLQAQVMLGDRMTSMGTLAAGVAHEINNPLAYILANLEFVNLQLGQLAVAGAPMLAAPPVEVTPAFLETLTRLEGGREALAEALQGAERVRDIVRDLKTVSREDETPRGPVDLKRVLDSSIRMASNQIRHRALLVKDYGEVALVEGNEGRLCQVFLNLLINAAQAIPEGAAHQHQVRVTLRTDASGRAVVDVGDTGCGIPLEARARVFDPFFTTKAPGQGTGLGLSLCRGIVTTLGGELSFDSEVGKGTVFHVALPVSRETPPPAPAPPAPTPPTRRGRILVVDDEPLIGAAVKRNLSAANDVVVTTSGREAVDQVKAGGDFDLILSDLMMPEMTGMDLYAELKSISPALADKVVFFTGGAFTARAEAFFAEVSNARLEKPFEVEELRALVRSRLR